MHVFSASEHFFIKLETLSSIFCFSVLLSSSAHTFTETNERTVQLGCLSIPVARIFVKNAKPKADPIYGVRVNSHVRYTF